MTEEHEVTRSVDEPKAPAARDRERRSAAVRGSLLGAGVALVAVLVVIVNYLGWKYHARLDWTEEGFYSLSEQTENVLGALDEAGRDVEVVVFMAPGGELHGRVQELLGRYEAASSRLSVRWLDPERNPAEVQRLVDQYGITTRSVVFTAGEQRRAVAADELQELDYSAVQAGGQPEIAAFKGERLFTDALVGLLEEDVPKVLFTTGHGELRLDPGAGRSLAGLVEVIGRDNFELEEWQSRTAESVPRDADLVVVAGPTSAFLPVELEVLDRYLRRGGRLLVLLDPVFSSVGAEDDLVATGLGEWLAGYGVEVGRDLVLDPRNRVSSYGPETLFVTDYRAHPVTGSLGEREIPSILSVARSVGAGDAGEGTTVTELLRTSAEAWGETDFGTTGEATAGPDDRAGPLSLAVAVEADDDGDEGSSGEDDTVGGEDPAAVEEVAAEDASFSADPRGMRLAVIGDSDVASGLLLSNPGLGNSALVNNLFNWLVERRSLLGIPPKRPEQVRLSMTPGELRWSVLGVTVLLPGLAVLAGIWVWSRRRKTS